MLRVSAPSGYLYDVNMLIIGRGIHVVADGPLVLPLNPCGGGLQN